MSQVRVLLRPPFLRWKGRVAERSKAPVSKTGAERSAAGSNPAPSATKYEKRKHMEPIINYLEAICLDGRWLYIGFWTFFYLFFGYIFLKRSLVLKKDYFIPLLFFAWAFLTNFYFYKKLVAGVDILEVILKLLSAVFDRTCYA